ncbi:cation channel sperm-associated protein 3-like [Erinaceus europaeus]|uniref:Cation channel sperm-associated protein 3-like n=1 Tax=Erinaceus europaeus TaxID=9365 RepID=A0ABM3X0J8_ERIEU|nr:cation channel sperm-associated protein 3-like [Erinaceus europaeus]
MEENTPQYHSRIQEVEDEYNCFIHDFYEVSQVPPMGDIIQYLSLSSRLFPPNAIPLSSIQGTKFQMLSGFHSDPDFPGRKDPQCQEFVKGIIVSPLFKIFMITGITCDASLLVLWTNYEAKYHLFRLYEVSQIFIIAVYGVELFLKLYVDPVGYWANGYNLLDICIMFIISIPYTMINFKGLHYPYLKVGNGLQSLRVLKLITYSQDIRTLLSPRLHSEQFFISPFNYTVKSILKNADYESFSDLVKNFKQTLQHDDPMVLDDFGTSMPFIDVYLTTLDNQDTTIYTLQELYCEILHMLSLMLEEWNENQEPQPENQQPQPENQQPQPENQQPQPENQQLQPENQQLQPENQQPQPENQQPQHAKTAYE